MACLRMLIPVLWLLALAGPMAAMAATWVVGAGGDHATLAQALRVARDGDTIALQPGTYRGDVGVVTQRALTIRGVGARPVLAADGRHAEGKAILVVRHGDVVLENLEFRGARVPDRNGAGIRLEHGQLTVRRCAFIDNEMGILTGNRAGTALTVEDSEFGHAPADRGAHHHLLYAGRIDRLRVTGSRFHHGHFAHLIKSRARESFIAYNLIVDGPEGQAAYEVDLPNGGRALLLGNVIGQSADSTNPVLVSYGAEGEAWPDSTLTLAHNTLLSQRAAGAWFLRVWQDKLPAGTAVHALNNLTVGLGVFSLGAPGHFEGNYPALPLMLEDVDTLRFAPRPGSLLHGRGVAPRLADGTDLAPRAEFWPPLGTRAIATPAAWTPGAFQR